MKDFVGHETDELSNYAELLLGHNIGVGVNQWYVFPILSAGKPACK
jgi:hypothetical protein